MPAYPNGGGIVVTVGAIQGTQRYQCVFPFGTPGTSWTNTMVADFEAWLNTTFFPAWCACLPTTTQILGFQIEGMVPGVLIPRRFNYQSGQFPGTRSGEPCPLQSSMLTAFYSTDQVGPGHRLRVAKKFWGAPSESDQVGGDIDVAGTLYANLVTLSDLLVNDISVGGAQARLLLEVNRSTAPSPASDVWPCTDFNVRQTLFTQRRRMKPVL